MKPNALKIAPALALLLLASATLSWGATDSGNLKSVEYLYSIDTVGGRGDRLRAPVDMFFDQAADELYVVDADNRGVLVFSSSGIFLQELAESRRRESPRMVATDSQGRIYVGHGSSPWVTILTFRGELEERILLPGAVELPENRVYTHFLARGPEGSVYAFTTAGDVVKLDPKGEKHEKVALPGGTDAPNMIYGMTIDPRGRLIFSDMRPYSLSILDPARKSWSRYGSPGILYGQIARPMGIAADGDGHIFVTSLIRHKVLVYDSNGNFLEEFGGIGTGPGQFYMPTKIVSDGKDRIFVLEQPLKRIQVFRVTFPEREKTLAYAGVGGRTE